MPKIYAYIRISKDSSDAENQRFELLQRYGDDDGIEFIEETVSGNTDASDRQLGALIESLEPGDTLAVADVSRLGRRSLDVMETCAKVMKRKARLVAVKSNLELKDDIGSEVMFFALSIAARIEREMISERTKAALSRKKSEGKKLGRPKGSTSTNPTLEAHAADIATMRRNGISAAAIARTHGVARDTVRKFLKEKGL
ncbi:MAG: recombinase family protein [Saprospiraceae bacterium]|nr:recombinase family protein [Saprospiraceae bacterium]MCF8252146.1 recombinase family protein [Saprospiraceae bacterium]MCF8282445.1 recombinase family protein [Bacteroidales bacterium]MCF8313815.1 recombinase family protein [Saprospiraceae bacterium]MCF8442521.1 recombinase family protein [Saprospiraceae bacterium]